MNSEFIISRKELYRTTKAIREGAITIGFLGGSITEDRGYQRWSEKIINWFVETYPKLQVNVENAAIGGTGSDLAAYRVEKDIIEKDCDLVFLEYAVNDENLSTQTRNRSREGVIRKLLKNSDCDIIITYSFNRGMYEDMLIGVLPPSIEEFEVFAKYYQISSVFMGSYALHKLCTGRLQWEEWLPDGLHPQHMGSYVYAEPVIQLLCDQLFNKDNPVSPGKMEIPDPLVFNNWENACILPFETVERLGYWRLCRASGLPFVERIMRTAAVGSRLKFRFTGIGFCLVLNFGYLSSEYRYKIDQEDWIHSNHDRPNWIQESGWLRTDTIENLPNKEHQVEIEVLLGEGDLCRGSNFELCYIGIIP